MIATSLNQFEELAKASSFQSATPIVLALMECDAVLRDQAIELFQQLASGQLDESERFATINLIAEILFPETDSDGLSGIDAEGPDEDGFQVKDHRIDQSTAFAIHIQQLMNLRGITQAVLAEKVGIGQPSISMMLQRNSRPQRKTILKFAEALGVKPDQLWPGFVE
jgi:lambda repressor-like predicted transcriptional regulator